MAKNQRMTQEYNKENREKLWDSKKEKELYKEKVFGEKQTYQDPISGKILHKKQTAAQKKYHMKDKEGNTVSSKWAEHAAEVDHIIPLKKAHEKYKKNPFISDEDFKEIMNCEENYRVISKKSNTSKGDKDDWELILDKKSELKLKERTQMASENIKAKTVISQKMTARTIKNVGKAIVGESKKKADKK